MRMSPLQLEIGILCTVMVMLLLFEIITRFYDWYRIKHGIEEDRSLKNTFMMRYHKIPHSTFRILFEGILIIATGIMMILCYVKMQDYRMHGAFYDASWRDPDVENHFYFDTSKNEELQGIYDADPENFDFQAYEVCLVKFGCEDCEVVKDVINALPDNVYIVFSTSDIGKRYNELYRVNFKPCTINFEIAANENMEPVFIRRAGYWTKLLPAGNADEADMSENNETTVPDIGNMVNDLTNMLEQDD